VPEALELEGFEEFIQALERAPEIAMPLAEQAMTNSLAMLSGALREYPPASEGNQPGRFSLAKGHRPMDYYERGRGEWRPVMQRDQLPEKTRKREGFIGLGKRKARLYSVAGYKLRRSSENLGKSWTYRVTTLPKSVIGELGNDTSYAEYVQGTSQYHVHTARDWQTTERVLDEFTPAIIAEFAQARDRLVEELTK
jgi:hypothetical protein